MAEIAQATGGKPIEIWFSDEARVGQTSAPRRRWDPPRHVACGAEEPAHRLRLRLRGDLPRPRQRGRPRQACCTTEAIGLRLEEIAQTVAPGAHAVLLLDQAGWPTTKKLAVPANITLLLLSTRAPEPNPVENFWQLVRDNRLGNRIFKSYVDILDHCCHDWSSLIDQPRRIVSIGLRA